MMLQKLWDRIRFILQAIKIVYILITLSRLLLFSVWKWETRVISTKSWI